MAMDLLFVTWRRNRWVDWEERRRESGEAEESRARQTGRGSGGFRWSEMLPRGEGFCRYPVELLGGVRVGGSEPGQVAAAAAATGKHQDAAAAPPTSPESLATATATERRATEVGEIG